VTCRGRPRAARQTWQPSPGPESPFSLRPPLALGVVRGARPTAVPSPTSLRDTARAMSEENVEVVQEVLAAWNSYDFARWLECWSPTCEWVPDLRGQIEGPQTYRGHEGLRRFWGEDDAVWENFRVEVHYLREAGDEVLAIGTGTARGKESGAEISRPFAFRFRVDNGKIVRGESYLDVTKALEAVGLSY
jgi:uncharacterized protein